MQAIVFAGERWDLDDLVAGLRTAVPAATHGEVDSSAFNDNSVICDFPESDKDTLVEYARDFRVEVFFEGIPPEYPRLMTEAFVSGSTVRARTGRGLDVDVTYWIDDKQGVVRDTPVDGVVKVAWGQEGFEGFHYPYELALIE